MIAVKKMTEETPEFIAAWEAPIQSPRMSSPVEESPEFVAAWEAPRHECDACHVVFGGNTGLIIEENEEYYAQGVSLCGRCFR